MISKGRAAAWALALTAAFMLPATLPTFVAAQQTMMAPAKHGDKLWQALQAANLRPDQQAHIEQLIAAERAKAKSETDKTARKADKKQLRRDILATLDPNQRDAFKSALKQLKEERRAEKAGVAPQQH
jgi:Spy/CpxP family protein refolding chaperone